MRELRQSGLHFASNMKEQKMTAPTAKPWITSIHAYVPGRAKAAGNVRVIKLSSNENAFGPSPKATAAMAATANGTHRYPDGRSQLLRAAIAAHHGLDVDRVVCGTGSDDILYLLALAYAGPGDEVLYSRHGFMVYPLAAERVGATPIEVADSDYTADVDALLGAVTERTKLLYLANPNNPTGTMINRAEVERLHAGLPPHVILVLDAAYAEYVDTADYEDGIALAAKHENVITTRTFSKIYGLAAARVGWAYGPKAIIDTLDRIRAPFNVTSAAQAGAVEALADTDWIENCRAENTRLRSLFMTEIAAMGNAGLRAVPSAANFVLVTFPSDGRHNAEAAYTYLATRGVLTRWLPDQGLGHAIRVSIGTEDETRTAIDTLRAYIEETD